MSPLLASLLHSLWIGLALWAGLRVVLRVAPLSARARHGAALAAVIALFAAWGCVWMTQGARLEASTRGETVAVSRSEFSFPASVGSAVSEPERAAEPAIAPTAGGAWLGAKVEALRRAATVQGCLEAAWAAGVLAGLLRLGLGLRSGGGSWLAGRTTEELPAAWLEAWRGELEACGRRLKTRLVAIEAAGAPFVIGFFEPAIVVPLASCAGVSPALARAALAHELAHVARRDWLVEIGLRVLEAVLFFNPFAWLLTARVRAEREACCDLWACERLGLPRVEFAEALAGWGRWLTGHGTAAPGALALGREGAGLRERVERLLGRGCSLRPRARSWRSAIGVLGLVLAGLACYGVALRWGASVLRDAERVRLLDQAAAPYVVPDWQVKEAPKPARPVRTVTGRVADEAGQPVVGATVHLFPSDPREETWIKTDATGSFRAPRPIAGPVTFRVEAEDFALAKGAIQANESEPAASIVLTGGISVPFKIVDEVGRPLVGARVEWSLANYAPRDSDRAVAGEDGVVRIDHLPRDIAVEVRAEAFGRVAAVRGPLNAQDLQTEAPLEIRLRPGRRAKVRLVADEDGRPLVGARLRIGAMTPAWSPSANPYPSWSFRGVVTDGDGFAILDHLRDDADYVMKVELPGNAEFSFRLETANSAETTQVVAVPPRWKTTVALQNFPEGYRGKSLRLEVTQTLRFGNNGSAVSQPRSVRIDVTGTGRLEVTGLGAGEAELVFDEPVLRPLNLKLTREQIAAGSAVIDYARLPAGAGEARMRPVAIRFMNGRREMFPAGRFYIHRMVTPAFWDMDGFALEVGKPLVVNWPVGTRLKLTDGWALVGAVIDLEATHREEIVIDERMREIVVPVRPAGLVRVQVRDAEGRWEPNAYANGSTDHAEHARRRRILFPNRWEQAGDWQVSGPVEFSFWGTPLWASRGLLFVRGPSVSVSARKPVADITLTLPKARSCAVRVIDDAGRAVVGAACAATLRFGERYGDGPTMGMVEGVTDERGVFRFEAREDVTAWKDVELAVDVSAPGLARTTTRIAVRELNAIPELRMPRAREFHARFVNRATGAGVSGVSVKRQSVDQSRVRNASEAISDAEGRLLFRDVAPNERFRLEYDLPREQRLRFPSEPGSNKQAWSELGVADSGIDIFLEPE